MRAAFIDVLSEIAARDPRVFLLTGDLGFMVVEPFADRFPDRFLNVGVAEQNMVGVATGLAEAGFVPFTYSIANFSVLRPYEFIRNGPVLHRLKVRIVGVGGGFEYGTAGPTHHGLEDVAVMRALGGMQVIAPADHEQAANALRRTWDLPGPIYYRLGKDDIRVVPGLHGRFEPGAVHVVRPGRHALIVAMGAIATEVVAAADLLAGEGIDCAVAVVASVSPAPVEALRLLVGQFDKVFSVEAHRTEGGLGSLVCEVVAAEASSTRVVRVGVNDPLESQGLGGSEAYLNDHHGLSAPALARTIAMDLAGRLVVPTPSNAGR